MKNVIIRKTLKRKLSDMMEDTNYIPYSFFKQKIYNKLYKLKLGHYDVDNIKQQTYDVLDRNLKRELLRRLRLPLVNQLKIKFYLIVNDNNKILLQKKWKNN